MSRSEKGIHPLELQSLRQELSLHHQQHLLRFWDRLSSEEQRLLFDDLKSINFGEVVKIFEESTRPQPGLEDDLLEPLSEDIHECVSRSSRAQLEEYRKEGLRQVSEGRVAVLLLAGGQGTRLGVNYPKGMYDVGLPSKKSLFQLQGERIRRVQDLAHQLTGKWAHIPWYIMTSEHTKEPTQEFFADHNYFGLCKENIVLFEQNTLPCFTFEGKAILEKPFRVARAPDGNGGLYSALRHWGILEDMERRGTQYVHVYGVDNILVKMADPTFIGYCVKKGAEAGAKVVEKSFPTEPVGIFCKVKGKYQVVEYSEVSMHVAETRRADGRLTFGAGNICNHFFTLDFLKQVSNGKQLKHHVAAKKISYANDEGVLVKPDKTNGIKLEKFVFDVFQLTNDFVVWEVLREDEFSPLKNDDSSVKDTPTTARHSIFNLHSRYVINAGGSFVSGSLSISNNTNGVNGNNNNNGHHANGSNGKKKENGQNGQKAVNGMNGCNSYVNGFEEEPIVCEISPLLSYDGEGLQDLVAGKRFTSPLSLPQERVEEPKRRVAAKGVKEMNGSNGVTVVNGIQT